MAEYTESDKILQNLQEAGSETLMAGLRNKLANEFGCVNSKCPLPGWVI